MFRPTVIVYVTFFFHEESDSAAAADQFEWQGIFFVVHLFHAACSLLHPQDPLARLGMFSNRSRL